MDYNMTNGRMPGNMGKYASISGRIAEIMPHGIRNGMMDSCQLLVGVEGSDGSRNNFIVTPSSFVVDFVTLRVGMRCTFWYRTDAPMLLIYPPQYRAVVVAVYEEDRSIDVGYYDETLLNDTGTLRLNVSRTVNIRTTNNQMYIGEPAGKDLVVIYDSSTRSIPAQTTPREVFVLCE